MCKSFMKRIKTIIKVDYKKNIRLYYVINTDVIIEMKIYN